MAQSHSLLALIQMRKVVGSGGKGVTGLLLLELLYSQFLPVHVGILAANGLHLLLSLIPMCVSFLRRYKNRTIRHNLLLQILNLLLMLQRYLILAVGLLILDQYLHYSQNFLILYLDEVELFSDHGLAPAASDQLLELYVDLADVEMRVSTEDIDDCVIVQ